MKKQISIVLIAAFLVFFTINANAAIKPGATCKRVGLTSTFAGKKYTCIQSGKKLVWNKGVSIVALSPTPKPIANESPSPTSSENQKNIELTDKNEFVESKNCKLKDISVPATAIRALSSGFPASGDLYGKKEVNILGLYVDFPDMPGLIEPKLDSPPIVSKFNDFYQSNSYGRFKANWTIPNKYFHLSQKVDFYHFSLKSMNEKQGDWANVFKFPQDVINSADDEFDFSKFDALIIFTPPQATDAEIGDVSPGDVQGLIGYKSKDGPVRNIRTYVGSWRSSEWADPRIGDEYVWRGLVHEFGHILGLPDYYMLDFVNRFDSYVGQYDLMGVPQYGQAPDFFAWSRWILGWLSDNQVICNTLKSAIVELHPIEDAANNQKFIIVPINANSAIGIESRRSIGFDSKMDKKSEGVLVYKIDTSKPTQKGPVQIQSIRPNPLGRNASESNLFKDASLKVGEKIIIGEIRIEVLRSESDSDVIKIVQ